MLDKLQTWQLPYLYSIKIELSISGHEINEKKHIALSKMLIKCLNIKDNISLQRLYRFNKKEREKEKERERN